MSRTKQSVNTTHRKRLARRYAAATGLTYQQALDTVLAAAETGVLPTPLDPTGMDAALRVLTTSVDSLATRHGSPTADAGRSLDEVMECVYCAHPMTYNATQAIWVRADVDVKTIVAAAGESVDLHELLGCDPGMRTGGLVAFLTAGWHALDTLAAAARDAADTDHHAVSNLRESLHELARDGAFTDLSLRRWAKQVYTVTDNLASWAADRHPHLNVVAGTVADQFADVLAEHYSDALNASIHDVDGLVEVYDANIAGPSHHLPAPRWLREGFFLETSDDDQRRALSHVAPMSEPRSTAVRKREEKRLLTLLTKGDGHAHIAGIVECRTALTLAAEGKIVIDDAADITDAGGSGWIRLTTTDPISTPSHTPTGTSSAVGPALATADDVIAGTARYADTPGGHADRATLAAEATERAQQHAATPQTWFVAHEGNPVPRCTGTSWRGNSRQGKKPYGPGGFNRCVKAHGHTPEDGGDDVMHVDEWGNVFRMTPNFKVVRTITNAEMSEIAREAGMAVGTHGSYQSKADAMKPNTLWVTADNEMVKLSNLYLDEDRVTAQVVHPVPARTTVRSYTLAAAASWKTPSAAQMRRYERAWGFTH